MFLSYPPVKEDDYPGVGVEYDHGSGGAYGEGVRQLPVQDKEFQRSSYLRTCLSFAQLLYTDWWFYFHIWKIKKIGNVAMFLFIVK